MRNQTGQKSGTGDQDFDLILSILPSFKTDEQHQSDSEEEEEEELLRETSLLLLRYIYAKAHASLHFLKLEMDFLKSAPADSPRRLSKTEDAREKKREDERDAWKLDAPRLAEGGPLLDSDGKPLQPFTILPAGHSERSRHQAGVFAPGYRLPTMSVDEYLRIEQERGNILTGGGPQQDALPTESEQLAIDAEQDGTAFGRDREEMKRTKDENWARYTDENQKGAGNTMNRG